MTKTIKSVIGNYCIQKLTAENKALHEKGTPRLFINSIKNAIEQYKKGDFQVSGMTRKYTVADEEVTAVYVATATAYNWSLPARGDEVDTEILYMQTLDSGFYYDYFSNTIVKNLDELNLKEGSVGEFKSFVLTGEEDEPTHYYLVKYTVQNSPVLSTVVTFGGNKKIEYVADLFAGYNDMATVVSVTLITKAQAVARGLNF